MRLAITAAFASLILVIPAKAADADHPLDSRLRGNDGIETVVHMRDTGYVLGDFIEQRIELIAPPSARLARESVPALGRINNWLELREAESANNQLILRYQVFAAVEQALQLSIPSFSLRMLDGEAQTVVAVPPQPFYLSPVLPAALREHDRQPRASPAPEPLPQRELGLRTLAFGVLALGFSLYLAWIYDRLPFFTRGAGPLSLLFRKLRKKSRSHVDAASYRGLLQDVHAALNSSARETLYEASLPTLFARAPHLSPLRAEIESFFRHSREVFYGPDGAAPWPVSDLLSLCRRARDCERGLA